MYCFLFGWKRCCFFCLQKKSPEVENRSSEPSLHPLVALLLCCFVALCCTLLHPHVFVLRFSLVVDNQRVFWLNLPTGIQLNLPMHFRLKWLLSAGAESLSGNRSFSAMKCNWNLYNSPGHNGSINQMRLAHTRRHSIAPQNPQTVGTAWFCKPYFRHLRDSSWW